MEVVLTTSDKGAVYVDDITIIKDSYRLLLGDCLDRMKEIPDGSVDMVLCDPPYGITACPWDSVLPLDVLWKEWERAVKSNGIIVLFGTEPFSTTVRASNLKRYKYDWIWKKKNSTGFLLSKQQPLRNYENIMVFYSSDIMNDTTLFFQKSKDYMIEEKRKAEADGYNMGKVLGNYMGCHYFTRKTQFAFPKREDYEKLQTTGYFKREYDEAKREYDESKREYDKAKRVTYNPQMTAGKPYKVESHKKKEDLYGYSVTPKTVNSTGDRYPVQVIEFHYDNDNGYHPTQKPVPLLEYLIRTYTNPGETVLDNCMGSGSTGVACINTGRQFIGIEKDEGYFGISVERMERAVDQQALLYTE